MPRTARKKSDTGIYHAMVRGINRQIIFQDDEDCEKYLQCLAASQKISGFLLHAYCLMGNHVHLLIQEQKGQEPLELIFKRIGSRYVYWYNWKYKRTGHLFQDRFKSEPIHEDAHFLAVLRYIYQNPVRAGLCKNPAEYPWSSYSVSLYQNLVDRTKTLELLPEDQMAAFIDQPSEETFLDIDSEGRLNDREAAKAILRICQLEAVNDFVWLPLWEQAEYFQALQAERCSIRQLARLTGVSKARIERMLRE